MVPCHIPFILLVAACMACVDAIMVPTGKIGGIMPAKPMALIPRLAPAQYQAPAPVWERIDEGDNPYSPPIYNYILWDYVQKYGHHTLIATDADYYQPQQVRIQPAPHFFYKSKAPEYFGKGSYTSYSKNKMSYYSPYQKL